MAEPLFDVVVLGAGVAGATAAAVAARRGRRVCVVSRSRTDARGDWIDWLHPESAKPLGEAGVTHRGVAGDAIAALTFHSADLKKHANGPRLDGICRVELGALRRALRKAATDAGATMRDGCAAIDAAADEDRVRVQLADGARIDGRLLIIADGAESRTAVKLGVRDPRTRPAVYNSAQADVTIGKTGKGATDAPGLHLVFDAARPLDFGYLLRQGKHCCIGLVEAESGEAPAVRLTALAERCSAGGLLPAGSSLSGAVRVRRTPRGAALEYESHVGKRSLAIGDAGGFVSALSQDGLYPALVTGECAALSVDAALNEKHVQDALQQFDAQWRMRLADQLRLPGTDLRFVAPMVFSNATMATRLARAFMLGENL